MKLLFTGGYVLTMDGLDRIASGVTVRDGRIVATNTSRESKFGAGKASSSRSIS